MKTLFSLTLLVVAYLSRAQSNASVSFEQVISLRQAGSPMISPDGQSVAFSITTTDWKENTYDTEIWLSLRGAAPFQLTRTPKGNSVAPRWSPDGQWLAFLADRGEKMQIQVMRIAGGEAQAVTKETEGIQAFEWSPDGKKLAFLKNEPESKSQKATKERYGGFAFDDEEYTLSHLWWVEFKPDLLPNEWPCYDTKDSTQKKDCIALPKPERLTQGSFTVTSFTWSPDGTKIAFNQQPNPLINTFFRSDISMVEVATKKVITLVKNPSNDSFVAWSPDSRQFLYESAVNDTLSQYYKNDRIFRQTIGENTAVEIAKNFDENKNVLAWTPEGVFFTASQRAAATSLFKLNLNTGVIDKVSGLPDFVNTADFTLDGKTMAVAARSATSLSEIYLVGQSKITPLTQMTQQIANWKTPVSEIVKWKSKDGTEIEGVLHKPRDFDPKRKYPLLVVVHGGPTGIDQPMPLAGSVYPVAQWVEEGAVVLRPNYRGSAGYGEKFRALNVRNLGVGDMEDVMSGVAHLETLGFVDSDRMGCMGWSQGGYISAFLTTNTNRFKAISVGAGISNWMTYYVNTDIHPFTRQYLKATPWQDNEVYLKTSPMTNIRNAKTPTLIQHGEFDRRVPIANAYELLQGLQDNNVPAKLVVYKGFGHGITKPKERLAAIWHNYQWFGKYIFGKNIEIPTAEK